VLSQRRIIFSHFQLPYPSWQITFYINNENLNVHVEYENPTLELTYL
jgi:hypothetical protein